MGVSVSIANNQGKGIETASKSSTLKGEIHFFIDHDYY